MLTRYLDESCLGNLSLYCLYLCQLPLPWWLVESTKQDGYLYFWCPRWEPSTLLQTPLQFWLEQLRLCWVCQQAGITRRAAACAGRRGNVEELCCKIWRIVSIILQSPDTSGKHSMILTTCLPAHQLAQVPPDSTKWPQSDRVKTSCPYQDHSSSWVWAAFSITGL